MLGVLFLARMMMAFQFQSVAALSPVLADREGLSLAGIGLLIGLYLAPGLVIALPGGAVAARLGDKRVVAAGMLAMLAGGGLAAWGGSWEALVAGRLIAGAGGVVLNVVMTKMLVDWFAGREISTALAIYVNSWPVGIAAALLLLPVLATAGGLALAEGAMLGLIALAFALFVRVYRAPEGAGGAADLAPGRLPLWPLLMAASIWGLYNVALAMVFSFGPALLTDRGWSLADAGRSISLFMIVFAVALPLGGTVADRTGRRDLMIAVSLVAFAALMPLIPVVPAPAAVALLVLAGGLFALAAGPIMTLPSVVLDPANRAFGMGLFFTVYYVVMMVAPRIAGGMADRAGSASVALTIGTVLCLVSLGALVAFRRMTRTEPAA
jgi:MFS family permease